MIATNMKDIEKIYADSYNHDVKALVVYTQGDDYLYSDAECTKPVDCKLVKDLFVAGVVICEDTGAFRAVGCYAVDGNPGKYALSARDNTFYGYDVENNCWAKPNSGGNPT